MQEISMTLSVLHILNSIEMHIISHTTNIVLLKKTLKSQINGYYYLFPMWNIICFPNITSIALKKISAGRMSPNYKSLKNYWSQLDHFDNVTENSMKYGSPRYSQSSLNKFDYNQTSIEPLFRSLDYLNPDPIL